MLQFPKVSDDSAGKQEQSWPDPRRSPAEYYIKYRLLLDPKTDPVLLAKDLEREMVFSPRTEYIPQLRSAMPLPVTFRPYNLTDRVSTDVLLQHGVWSMFHPSTAVKEATRAFKNDSARQLLEALASLPAPNAVICSVFYARTDLPLSEEGLKEFRHYFWNTQLMRQEELVAYVLKYYKDKLLAGLIRTPPSPEHLVIAYSKLGVHQEHLDEREVLEAFQRQFYIHGMDAAARPAGMATMTAMNMAYQGWENASKRLELLNATRGNLYDEASRFQIATLELQNPTLRQLTEGTAVPFPVSMLLAESEDDKEVTG